MNRFEFDKNYSSFLSLKEQFLLHDPDNPDYWFESAHYLLSKGLFYFAQIDWHRAILSASNPTYLLLKIGNLCIAYHRFQDSAHYLKITFLISPQFSYLYNNLAVCYQYRRESEKAVLNWKRALFLDPNFAEAHANLGHAYGDLGQNEFAILHNQKAIFLDRDHPDSYVNLALLYERECDYEKAYSFIKASLLLHPEKNEFWLNSSLIQQKSGDLYEAYSTIHKAIICQPDRAESYFILGSLFQSLNNAHHACQSFIKSLCLDPCHYGAWFNFAMVSDKTIPRYWRAIYIFPNFADAWHNLAMKYLDLGNFSLGWTLYRWRWKTEQLGRFYREFREPEWQGELGFHKTIFLHGEQGFGDRILFCRYVDLVAKRGWRLILEAPPSLYRLFQTLANVDQLILVGDPIPSFDCHASLMSLPAILETRLDTIPVKKTYLFADIKEKKRWKKRLVQNFGKGPKIGLVWARTRPPPLKQWINSYKDSSLLFEDLRLLFDRRDLTFFSLQKNSNRHHKPYFYPENFIDWMDEIIDFAGTAALIDSLDLVITVDTAIVHLAAAMGKPVWLLLRHKADWRWNLDETSSPWYPSVRIFRQDKPGDWLGVIQSVHQALTHIFPPDKNLRVTSSFNSPSSVQRVIDQPHLSLNYYNLGVHQKNTDFYLRALSNWKRSQIIDTYLPQAPVNRGNILVSLDELEKANQAYRQALIVKPDHLSALNNLSLENFNRGFLLESITLSKRSLTIDPKSIDPFITLSQCYFALGDFIKGWQFYEKRWLYPSMQQVLRRYPEAKEWRGEIGYGRVLLLYHESGGYGDCIQNCRFALLAKKRGWRIILEVPASLVTLLSRMEGVESVHSIGESLPSFQYYYHLGSMGFLLETDRLSLPRAPYLRSDPVGTELWRQKLNLISPHSLKVGIAWTGKASHHDMTMAEQNLRRTVPFDRLCSLFSLENISFVSLQKDRPPLCSTLNLYDAADDIKDFSDSADLVQALDLVITVDTALAHLAGAIGKRVWMLNRFDSDGRWALYDPLYGEINPWYSSLTIFKQDILGDWSNAVDRIYYLLKQNTPQFIHYCMSLAQERQNSEALKDAVRIYRAIMIADPSFALAYYNCGVIYRDLDDLRTAQFLWERCLTLDALVAQAHSNLGNSYSDQGKQEKALSCFYKAIIIKPDLISVYNNLSTELLLMNDLLTSEIIIKKALVIAPDFADAHNNLAMTLLTLGRFEEGWPLYEWRWEISPLSEAKRKYFQPEWRGEPSLQRRLLIYAEQGFGDSLQFCRYATLVARMGWIVILEVPQPLVSLMQSLEGPAVVVATGDHLPDFDYHCAMMSLPLIFKTTLESIPKFDYYLYPRPEIIQKWKEKLSSYPSYRLKVGLAWAGNPRLSSPQLSIIDQRRSIDPNLLTALFDYDDILFVSLQKDPGQKEGFEAIMKGNNRIDLMSQCDNFEDSAALITQLDLVISVDTAIVHLASAIGQSVWMLDRYDSCWRWLKNREDSPWYPRLKIFRQDKPYQWQTVLESVKKSLGEFHH